VLQCVAVWYRELQRVAESCRVLQSVAECSVACCGAWHGDEAIETSEYCHVYGSSFAIASLSEFNLCLSVFMSMCVSIKTHCSICVGGGWVCVCHKASVLLCVALCCSVLPCVAVCCHVLQCVVVCVCLSRGQCA